MRNRLLMFALTAALAPISMMLLPIATLASDSAVDHGTVAFPLVFLAVTIMLLLARTGALIERVGQPVVLGELAVGILLSALALVPSFGLIDEIRGERFITELAEVGVILLLFKVGLESNLKEMAKVGGRAFLVAAVGVVLPFVLGAYVFGPMLLPGLDWKTYLFLGATLTATSVGITARVFQDLGASSGREAKIVLGAAVIDDILGLLILAVVSAIVSTGSVTVGSVAVMLVKAIGFLTISVALGQALAPHLGDALSKVHSGVGMKMSLALAVCGMFAYGAHLVGLAPIVGAFAAGLVLDPVHFRKFASPRISAILNRLIAKQGDPAAAEELKAMARHEEERHVENLVEGVSRFFVPIFFVYTGMQVNLAVFGDLPLVAVALGVTLVAMVGKIAAGAVAGKGTNRLLVGCGMVPRGEVGLIFANVGKQLGVVDDRIFAVTVIVVIMTTLVTPPLLAILIRRGKAQAPTAI